ncbi:hypothetical protein KW805_01520 [Candidatus Pacearchaeota archaeon]|nr:hypothetical protein [Candidatus Pacearchaeota archaeon]
MLTGPVVKKIEEFVYPRPRSIQEIAVHINKNWRTADRYVDAITNEYGTLAARVFRGGTRGALKIVYWASVEKASSSVLQEKLEKDIFQGKTKHDFSPFDIYQYVPEKKKVATVKVGNEESLLGLADLKDILLQAQKQILIFSGNLSFFNLKDKHVDIEKVFQELTKKGITIKALSRVDLGGISNIEKMISLNKQQGKELVEIRHNEQPLRAVIVDNVIMNLKQVEEPMGKKGELSEKTFVFYTIKDKEWIEWMTKIFWKMFSSSISAEKRLHELHTLKRLKGS